MWTADWIEVVFFHNGERANVHTESDGLIPKPTNLVVRDPLDLENIGSEMHPRECFILRRFL